MSPLAMLSATSLWAVGADCAIIIEPAGINRNPGCSLGVLKSMNE